MPFLFHNNPNEIRILDCEGRTHIIPPNRAWRVPDLAATDCDGTRAYVPISVPADKMVRYYLREGIHHGLVLVHETVTDSGVQFDLADADKRSTAARYNDKTELLNAYVFTAKDDELKKEPVKPPPPVIQAILDERGLDLEKHFGIRPVGHVVSESMEAREKEVMELKRRNDQYEKELADMRAILERVVHMQTVLSKDPQPKTQNSK